MVSIFVLAIRAVLLGCKKKIPNKLWGKFHGIMSLLLSKRIYFFKLADFASMGQINIFNLDYFAT